MRIGFWMCFVLVPCFVIPGLLFAVLKEKAAKFVSGFNTLPKAEQDLYDRAYLARDMRNDFFLWSLIMLIGALGSLFLTAYAAVLAYVLWLILFFKNVHLDAHKAFAKYLYK